MHEFVDWLNDDSTIQLHPVELAALAHYKFVYIHPFIDGNGRTSRLLMNLILMQARGAFFHLVEKLWKQKHKFEHFIASCNSYDTHWVTLKFAFQAGFPPVTIRMEDRLAYYERLQAANEGDLRPFIRFIAEATDRTLQQYINAVTVLNTSGGRTKNQDGALKRADSPPLTTSTDGIQYTDELWTVDFVRHGSK